MGLTMQEKKAVTRQIRSRYLKAGRKEKSAILDEFIQITGYKNRKYVLRILNQPEVPQALLVVKGKTVKLKPQKKDPPTGRAKKSIPKRSSPPPPPQARPVASLYIWNQKRRQRPIPVRVQYTDTKRSTPGFCQTDTGGL